MAQTKSPTTRQARLAAQEQARVERLAEAQKPEPVVEPPKREKREKPPKDAPAN